VSSTDKFSSSRRNFFFAANSILPREHKPWVMYCHPAIITCSLACLSCWTCAPDRGNSSGVVRARFLAPRELCFGFRVCVYAWVWMLTVGSLPPLVRPFAKFCFSLFLSLCRSRSSPRRSFCFSPPPFSSHTRKKGDPVSLAGAWQRLHNHTANTPVLRALSRADLTCDDVHRLGGGGGGQSTNRPPGYAD